MLFWYVNAMHGATTTGASAKELPRGEGRANSSSSFAFCLQGVGRATSTGALCMEARFSFAASTVALAEQEQLFSVGVLGVWKRKSCWRFRVENGANGVGVLGSLNTTLLHHFFQLFWLLLSLWLSWVW